jgi:hypothetical protein
VVGGLTKTTAAHRMKVALVTTAERAMTVVHEMKVEPATTAAQLTRRIAGATQTGRLTCALAWDSP